MLIFLQDFFRASAVELPSGDRWLDTSGSLIQAHGGGILQHNGSYYWFGEDRTPGGSAAVSCYSSTNLLNWVNEGEALAKSALPLIDGGRTFVERPKVLFNAKTGKCVMWMHLEQKGYHYARAGIAVSDSPTEPFTFLQAIRPITNNVGFAVDDPDQQNQFGGTFRDMNLFLDQDGRAYAFYASEGNWTMFVVRLNAHFTGPELPAIEGKTWSLILVRKMREAPAPFKHQGKYYVITSGCTGWNPNEADYAVAENVLGPYKSRGNPCIGPNAERTYSAQSTFVLPAPGKPSTFIFMADRWNPKRLSESRYLWLPFAVAPDGTITISEASLDFKKDGRN